MEWRKSTMSGNIDCVEIRQDLSAVRDSKSPVDELPVRADAVHTLVVWCRNS